MTEKKTVKKSTVKKAKPKTVSKKKTPKVVKNGTLDRAISIAAQSFEGKFDRGGKPYILHCLYVMHRLRPDQELMTIAVLHDLVEDTDWTFEMLQDEGFSHRVITALDCLTHRDGEDYEDYIHRVATNQDARDVKLVDLKHNSDITRMKGLRDKDLVRIEKYHRAYAYLTGK